MQKLNQRLKSVWKKLTAGRSNLQQILIKHMNPPEVPGGFFFIWKFLLLQKFLQILYNVLFMSQDNKKPSPQYLTDQLITYLGNKRSLLDFIGKGVAQVQKGLKKKRLSCLDVFSGSGIVSRYLKEYSSEIYSNDMEQYACLTNSCYLENSKDIPMEKIQDLNTWLNRETEKKVAQILTADQSAFKGKVPGFISELYAPKDLNNIKKEERCFYTPYNAAFLDISRQLIEEKIPEELKKFFIAPLIAQASVHANTGGIFKGFYKNSKTGIGKFGGTAANALSRIQGKITVPMPLFSQNQCPWKVFNMDSNLLAKSTECPAVDLAYLDPPYNQHPYGSNYFMLNLVCNYQRPDLQTLSQISGIPNTWNRSNFNKKSKVAQTFQELVENLRAKYLLISFNSDGFLKQEEMLEILGKIGKVTVLEEPYNTYRASRNLSGRDLYVTEFLYLVKTQS